MLLVQSCSKSKIQAEEPIPALKLYSGYFYKIIKKAKREGDIRPDFNMCIVSAKHGVIDPDTEITTYDRRMDSERAGELAEEISADLTAVVREGNHNEVLVNTGKEYKKALAGFENHVDADVHYLSGQLGERGKQLKAILRSSNTQSLPANAA